MRMALDCSVAPGFFFEEERNAYTESVRSRLLEGLKLLVPPLFHPEIANILRMQEKRGRWTSEHVENCVRDIQILPLITVSLAMSAKEILPMLRLARQYDLTAYDATYLLLALQEGVPLATQDKALAEAAKQEKCYFEG